MTRERFVEMLIEEGIAKEYAERFWDERNSVPGITGDEFDEPALRLAAKSMRETHPHVKAVYRRWYRVWKQYHYMEYLGMGAPRLRCSCGNEALTCGLLMAKGLVQISDQPEMQLLGRTRDCARRTASGETIH